MLIRSEFLVSSSAQISDWGFQDWPCLASSVNSSNNQDVVTRDSFSSEPPQRQQTFIQLWDVELVNFPILSLQEFQELASAPLPSILLIIIY